MYKYIIDVCRKCGLFKFVNKEIKLCDECLVKMKQIKNEKKQYVEEK